MGRKKVDDKKVAVWTMFNQSLIDFFGGEDELRKFIVLETTKKAIKDGYTAPRT